MSRHVARPYQTEVVNGVKSSLVSGKKRPILGLPTGAGKTVSFSILADMAQKKGEV